MQQLIMRGADVNFVNETNGYTPLHRAIHNKMDPRIVKFLIKQGAIIHSEDLQGLDCCDKAQKLDIYKGIKELNT